MQDLPKTVADGPSSIPVEFKDRIDFQAHDFYTAQPVKDADVYFFRWICHNQSDKYGVVMLQALIPALKKGARIIINDNCLPKPNTADPWDEKITRYVVSYLRVVREGRSIFPQHDSLTALLSIICNKSLHLGVQLLLLFVLP